MTDSPPRTSGYRSFLQLLTGLYGSSVTDRVRKGMSSLGLRESAFYRLAEWAKSQASVVIKCCYEACFLDFAFPGERVLQMKQALMPIFL